MPLCDWAFVSNPIVCKSSRRGFTIEFVISMGKVVIAIGAVMVLLGALLMLAGRVNLPLGRLPGDIVYRGKNTVFYFPLATSILLSVVLSLIFYIIGRFTR